MIPKAELHCHLEGSVPPALARELAARNGLDLPHGLFGDNGHYAWTDFLSFLDSYDRVCGVIRRPRDFGDILYSYLQRTAAEGAVYVEMFCSPERRKRWRSGPRCAPLSASRRPLSRSASSSANQKPVTVTGVVCR